MPALNLAAVLNPIAGDYNRDAVIEQRRLRLVETNLGLHDRIGSRRQRQWGDRFGRLCRLATSTSAPPLVTLGLDGRQHGRGIGRLRLKHVGNDNVRAKPGQQTGDRNSAFNELLQRANLATLTNVAKNGSFVTVKSSTGASSAGVVVAAHSSDLLLITNQNAGPRFHHFRQHATCLGRSDRCFQCGRYSFGDDLLPAPQKKLKPHGGFEPRLMSIHFLY